jgi:hypothetical protein
VPSVLLVALIPSVPSSGVAGTAVGRTTVSASQPIGRSMRRGRPPPGPTVCVRTERSGVAMTETTTSGAVTVPEPDDDRAEPTSFDELDRAIADLQNAKDAWVAQDIETRIVLLEEAMASTHRVGERWVRAACAAEQIDFDSPAAGEKWASVWLTIRNLRLLKRSLEDIMEHGRPQPPGEPWTRPDGQVVVPAFPTDTYDRLVFAGFSAEIWMQAGVTLNDLHEHQASIYHQPKTHSGRVCLVLGAGNVSAIPPMDTLTKLFQEDEVVLLKMNPVNDYAGPYIEEALEPLVRAGFVRVVYGGTEVGTYLTDHDGVDTIHMTGSDRTHDAIVFGTGEEGERRKAAREPRLNKPITSELGNITPVIVVPGPWSDGDIRYQAENIATMLVNNAGFNCIATRAIVTHTEWVRRHDLLDELRWVLQDTPTRFPYYPGAEERFERFLAEHPEAERYGGPGPGDLPWTLIPDLDPDESDDIAFQTEAFCSLTGEVPLEAPRDVAAFVDRAVEFCNRTLWGTLAATIIVHPRSLKDPDVESAVERAIANLRYGTVVVNHWPGTAFAFTSTPWGAYPGHDLHDIQSGRGWVHNTYLYDRPEKAVVRGLFREPGTPPWFTTSETSHEVFRQLADLELDRSPGKLPGLTWSRLRS